MCRASERPIRLIGSDRSVHDGDRSYSPMLRFMILLLTIATRSFGRHAIGTLARILEAVGMQFSVVMLCKKSIC